jgi:methylglutaconyl-CoA hydratase
VTDLLRVERTGPGDAIARVTLTRPDVHNAFNAELIGELRATFRRLSDEPADKLRGVVLAGAGPSFCAGADVTWMRASLGLSKEQNEQDAMVMAEMFDRR